MFEITVFNRLKEILSEQNIPIYMDRPENIPERYVLMEKTGATIVNHIPTVTLAFQSYAKRLYDCIVLNETVKNAVSELINYNDITRIELNSDYNFTDTATKTHRYQAVFVLYYYN